MYGLHVPVHDIMFMILTPQQPVDLMSSKVKPLPY